MQGWQPMLWEIENTNCRLLGSMHNFPADREFPKWVAASFDGVQRLVFEADIRADAGMAAGYDPTKAHLKFYGAPELYQRAEKLLAGIKANVVIDVFRPWKAAGIFQLSFIENWGYLMVNGVDQRLRKIAEEKGLQVDFFEPITHSPKLHDISCKPFQGGLAFFRRSILEIKSGKGQAHMQRMFEAWLANDLAVMAAVQAEELAESPYIVNVQLQRNREWVAVAKN